MSQSIVILLILLTILARATDTQADCEYDIVESTPDKLSFNSSLNFTVKSTQTALLELIKETKYVLRIASSYWTLSAEDEFASHPSSLPGKQIMDAIILVAKRGVDLEVVLDNSGERQMSNLEDIKRLESFGTVRYLNMTHLLGSGVMHNKMLISDNKAFYIGSSNFDWRSYTQTKEIGVVVKNCYRLGIDLDKVFRTYTHIAAMKEIPKEIPDYLSTSINLDHPIDIILSGNRANVFIGSAPAAFNGLSRIVGRTDDIEGLISVIDRAEKRIQISVMSYGPRTAFIYPKKFWPNVDDALQRAASERRVKVKLLFSSWSHSHDEELIRYKSLDVIQSARLRGGDIEVKLFKVPAFDDFQSSIPYARVKHDKYLVTDNGLWIGTSNCAPDYFINTRGVSLVISSPATGPTHPIIDNMSALFNRDFESEFAHPLE